MSRPALSIVLPAHNEAHRILPTLARYTEYFSAVPDLDFELLVVVNGSSDQTEQIVREFADEHPSVDLIVEPDRIGKGGAVMRGFQRAQGELIGFVDADGATSAEAYHDLVKHMGDAGMILASRWMKGAVVEPRQPLSRRIASRIFNSLVRILFQVRLTDTQCGAKLLQRQAVEDVLPHLGLTRWAFDVDLVFQVRRAGYRLIEYPTVWRDVAGSRLNIPKASFEMFIAVWRLRLLYSPFAFVVEIYNRIHRGIRRVRNL